MSTSTLSFCASGLTSTISPSKSESGPDVTLTDSPSVNSTCARVAGAPGGAARVEDPVDLGLRERRRLGAGPDERGHAGRALDDRPGLVVQVHVDEHVARQDALLDLHLLAVLRLDHLLGRDDDAPEARCLVHRDDPVLEVGLHLVLVPGVGVDHVPVEHRSSPYCPRSTSRTNGRRIWSAAPEEGADDRARDQHDDRALDHLCAVRPLDLAELADRLTDEAAAATMLDDRRGSLGPGGRRTRRARARGRLLPGGTARVTALSSRLLCHVRPPSPSASRGARVCEPHQRQYFRSSTRSGVFRFDFCDW